MFKKGDKVICINNEHSEINKFMFKDLKLNKIYIVKDMTFNIVESYVEFYEIPDRLYKIERFKTMQQIRILKLKKLSKMINERNSS